MNESATHHMVEYVASMGADGCTAAEIAGVLHRVAFDLVAEQHGLQAAAEWARLPDSPYDVLAAKAATTEEKSYLGWVGGLPVSLFVERGFIDLGEFDDPYMRDGVDEIPAEARIEAPWRFSLAALHLR